MSNTTNSNLNSAPGAPLVKLCGLYNKQRKRDGKTYLTGRLSLTSKLLVLPNDKKQADNEPDFWLCVSEDAKAIRPAHGGKADISPSSEEL